MKITIDTKEDSKEEIKKVIAMLQAMVDGQVRVAPVDIFGDSSSSPSSSPSKMDIFSDPAQSQPSQSNEPQQGGDIFSLFTPPETSSSSSEQTTSNTRDNLSDDSKIRVIRY